MSDKAWSVLVSDAAALTAPKAGSRRLDFTAALEAGPERIVVETQNVSAVRSLLFTLFAPGAFHRRRPGSGAAARPVAKEIDR